MENSLPIPVTTVVLLSAVFFAMIPIALILKAIFAVKTEILLKKRGDVMLFWYPRRNRGSDNSLSDSCKRYIVRK